MKPCLLQRIIAWIILPKEMYQSYKILGVEGE